MLLCETRRRVEPLYGKRKMATHAWALGAAVRSTELESYSEEVDAEACQGWMILTMIRYQHKESRGDKYLLASRGVS